MVQIAAQTCLPIQVTSAHGSLLHPDSGGFFCLSQCQIGHQVSYSHYMTSLWILTPVPYLGRLLSFPSPLEWSFTQLLRLWHFVTLHLVTLSAECRCYNMSHSAAQSASPVLSHISGLLEELCGPSMLWPGIRAGLDFLVFSCLQSDVSSPFGGFALFWALLLLA